MPTQKINKFKHETGQALLLVLLSMAVILTVVLSVSTKTVSDISVGTYEEDALRAFSAAEAGIEKALLTNQEFNSPQQVVTGDNSVTFTSEIATLSGNNEFAYPVELNSGESATFWLVGHDANGNLACPAGVCYDGTGPLRLCWGNTPEPPLATRPAVFASVFYDEKKLYQTGDFSNVKVFKVGFDNNAVARVNGFNTSVFTGPSNSVCNAGQKQYLYGTNPGGAGVNLKPVLCGNIEGCIILIKVGMYYNDVPQPVMIKAPSSVAFPSQGKRIESIGVAGNSTRKINVFESYAEPPGIFDTGLFSEGDIAK